MTTTTTANNIAMSDFTTAAVRKNVNAAVKAIEKRSDVAKGYTASWGGAIRWACNASEANGNEGATIRAALRLTTDSNKAARRAAALRAAKYMPYYVCESVTGEDGTTHEERRPAALRRVATLDNGDNVYQAVIMTDYTMALIAAVRNLAVNDTTIYATLDARRKALTVVAAPTATDAQRKRATERAAALAAEISLLFAARHTHGKALALDSYYIGKTAENAHVANDSESLQVAAAIEANKRIANAAMVAAKVARKDTAAVIAAEKKSAVQAAKAKAERKTECLRRAAVKASKTA
jgi:hypothetical protein